MKQVVTEPTRITETTAKLLDIICVSKWTPVINGGTRDAGNVSDHRLAYCTLNHDILLPEKTAYKRRNFRYFNHAEFAFDASRIHWSHVDEIDDIDEKLKFFTDAITLLFDIHAPEVTVRRRRKEKPYITQTIKKMIQLKDRAYKKYIRSGTDNDRKSYKYLHNYVSNAIKSEKQSYIMWKTEQLKHNSKKLWAFFAEENVHNRARKSISPNLNDVNIMNNYFAKIATNTDTCINYTNFYKNNIRPGILEEFEFTAVTGWDIQRILYKVKSNACGVDAVDLRMLRICFPFCSEALVNIINFSLESGSFPTAWKKSIVIPLAKVSNAAELSQLRPISILPTASKILEDVVGAQLEKHIDRHHLLPSMQSAYRRGFSTSTALLRVTNDLTSAMDAGMASFLLLLDYSKAFDCLNRELLLAKLKYFGLGQRSLDWFKEYLCDRRQCVRYDNVLSGELCLCGGVAQGSILGPKLFSMYTFDLPYFVTKEVSASVCR